MEKKSSEEDIQKRELNNRIRILIYFNVILGIIIGIGVTITIFLLFSFIDWIQTGLILMVILSITHLP